MEFEKLKRVHLEQQTDGDVADCDYASNVRGFMR